jgi:hypothetical protein
LFRILSFRVSDYSGSVGIPSPSIQCQIHSIEGSECESFLFCEAICLGPEFEQSHQSSTSGNPGESFPARPARRDCEDTVDELAFEFALLWRDASTSGSNPIDASHDAVVLSLGLGAQRIEGQDHFQDIGGFHEKLLPLALGSWIQYLSMSSRKEQIRVESISSQPDEDSIGRLTARQKGASSASGPRRRGPSHPFGRCEEV